MRLEQAITADATPRGEAVADPPPESFLTLQQLRKDFGGGPVVDGVEIAFREGEFFSLLGPSGCGKTTTLRMIGGFERPTSGAILLDGADISHRPPHRRPVNTVFQSYALFSHLTVSNNVAFGLRESRVERTERNRRVAEAIALVRLQGFEGRRPKQLSGGQQQRVALARALVNRPRVLLLDEPLGALDLKLRKNLQIELKGLQSELGITFIYVTHDQEEALTMSDRIAVMRNGVIDQIGTPKEIYARPATAYVADFIGAANCVSGTLEAIDGGVARVRMPDGRVVAGSCSPNLDLGGRCALVVRPELCRLVAGPTATSLSGTLKEVLYLGQHHSLIVERDDGSRLTAYIPASVRTGALPTIGDSVHLEWQAEDAWVIAEGRDE